MKKILSIDGGGIRGIIPAMILVSLERKLRERTSDPQASLATYFDFFSGTSTGGILVCTLLCPDKAESKKPKFTADMAAQLYQTHGSVIFKASVIRKLFNYKSVFTEKYPVGALERVIGEYFGNVRLSQLLKPCLITAYNIQDRKAHFFASHDYPRKGESGDFLLRDVCRATSAAPTYFETALVRSLSGVSYPMVDGGMFANNPALCAYSEVRNAIGDPTAERMLIVSLGTGSQNITYPYSSARNWGAVGWIKPSIDIMMSGAAEVTNYHLERIFSASGAPENYIRIQPSDLRNANPAMDAADNENIQALTEVGIKTAQDCSDILDRIVDVLVNDEDCVEFQ